MGTAYTPGLRVTSRLRHRVRRILPIAGEVLASVGDEVEAQSIVAQTFMPGGITPVNLANILSLPPGDVADCVLVNEGERIEVGQPLARTNGIFGLFKNEYKSRDAGTVETVSSVTGQVIIRGEPQPVHVKAYLAGRVIEVLPGEGVVIEADVTFIQGIFGIGGEAFGTIRMGCERHDQELTADRITDDMTGCIVIAGARMQHAAITRARDIGVAAIVAGGLDDHDLRCLLGYDLGVAITGSERIGLTLVITEGFGDIAMARRSFSLFQSREGRQAAVNGTTQIRAGVIRPEVIIPLSGDDIDDMPEPEHYAGSLQRGTPVRIIRDPFFGRIGEVADLPSAPQVLDSGSRARVLDVVLENGERVTVPRANVELIEG